QACPRPPACDLFYGAAIVDINKVRSRLGGDFSSLTHGINVTAEDLYAYGPLVLKNVQFLPAFGGVTDQAFRGDEFSIHEVNTVLFAYKTKRRIAHVFHGRQEQRKLPQIYISDSHCHFLCPAIRECKFT